MSAVHTCHTILQLMWLISQCAGSQQPCIMFKSRAQLILPNIKVTMEVAFAFPLIILVDCGARVASAFKMHQA